jgi:hypothetical protein
MRMTVTTVTTMTTNNLDSIDQDSIATKTTSDRSTGDFVKELPADRPPRCEELARIVVVEDWEINVALTGWGIIRCPHCKQILRPLLPMPSCIGVYTTHDLRESS